jgi:NAD(P)-dependent dehydrogenase (short-subunit alcohol dehydrogenase family)
MDRVALVTGGGRGIGAGTCRALGAQGLRIAVADINATNAREVAAAIPGAQAFEVDVSEEASVQKLFGDVEAALGPVGVLVCAAGGPFLKQGVKIRLTETSLDNWVRTEALNGRGTFLCVREYLRRREKAPVAHGRIVNIASMAALRANPATGVAYGASKSAVINITRHAASEGAPHGITANAICPGLIDTPAVRANSTDEQIVEMSRGIPVGRIGQPEDIAATVAFLVSPQASYLTGCTIEVNGGIRMA